MAELSTPPPVYRFADRGANPPPSMPHPERALYRKAAHLARQLYPGAIGELVASDLLAVDELYCVIGEASVVARARQQVLREWERRENERERERARART